jgi:hypothetical protein
MWCGLKAKYQPFVDILRVLQFLFILKNVGDIECLSKLNQRLFVSNFDIYFVEKDYCQITQDYKCKN